MNIQIKNYKNISDLNFVIDDGKINSLFGISGSGKTSIAESLLHHSFEENFSIGKEASDVSVIVDGKQMGSEFFRYYNIDTQNNLIIEQSLTNDVYSILFGDTSKLDEVKNVLHNLIADLDEFRTPMAIFMDEIEKVRKEFIGKLKGDGDLPKNSKLHMLEEDVNKISSDPESLKLISSQGSELIEWKIRGTALGTDYSNRKCPFCGARLEEETIQFIESIKKISPKNFSIIKESKIDFNLIKAPKPNDYTNPNDLILFKEALIKANNISNDLGKIMSFLSSVRNPSFNPSEISEIVVSEEAFKQFNGLESIVVEINGRLKDIKMLMGDMKAEFNTMVGSNLKRINNYVYRLGIPYKFELDTFDSDIKEATFKLYHVKDPVKKHRIGGLSFGERNMLSLILFLSIPDDKMLLIDDPASSYDDYRRKTILDIIYEFSAKRTCLILSHDHVFLKYSLFQKNNAIKKTSQHLCISKIERNYLECTGKIMYFENLSSPCIKEIDHEDFQPIYMHIDNHLRKIGATASFYRMIINLRLKAEISKYQNTPHIGIIYKFLSALLHKESIENITELLKKENTTVAEVLGEVKDVLGYDLVCIPDNYTDVFDLQDFTYFEKAILKREDVSASIEKDELDNLVHFNDSLAIEIDPYKFNLFSAYVFNIL